MQEAAIEPVPVLEKAVGRRITEFWITQDRVPDPQEQLPDLVRIAAFGPDREPAVPRTHGFSHISGRG